MPRELVRHLVADTHVQRAASAGKSDADSKRALAGLDFASQVQMLSPVQHHGATPMDAGQVQRAAERGIAGGGERLPHAEAIQASFGGHDIGAITAHVGGTAADANRTMGAEAYATGSHVAFASAPDLHTAAHEAAHIVQQQRGVQLQGGVGKAGDSYEQNADAVADRVVAGRSAEDLLGQPSAGGVDQGVQRKPASDAAPVQMYTKYPGGIPGVAQACRVADDGEMVVLDSDIFPEGSRALQVAWATPGVITASSDELERVGSGYELVAGGGAIQVTAPDGSGVKQLVRITARNLVNRTEGDEMMSQQNCNANMGVGMGLTQVDGAADRQNIGAHMGKRHRWYRHGDEDVDKTYSSTSYNDARSDARKLITGKDDGGEASTAYAGLAPDKRAKRGAYSHLNTGAKAGVGGGYGVFAGGGTDHFTPIVAASGGDEISLEAHAQDDPNRNFFANWYFRMYGPANKQQTFYDEMSDGYARQMNDHNLTVVAFQKLVTEPADANEANQTKATYLGGQRTTLASLITQGNNWVGEANAADAGSGARLAGLVARLQAVRDVQTTQHLSAAHVELCAVRDAIRAYADPQARETWFLNRLLSSIDAAGQRLIEVQRLDTWLANHAG